MPVIVSLGAVSNCQFSLCRDFCDMYVLVRLQTVRALYKSKGMHDLSGYRLVIGSRKRHFVLFLNIGNCNVICIFGYMQVYFCYLKRWVPVGHFFCLPFEKAPRAQRWHQCAHNLLVLREALLEFQLSYDLGHNISSLGIKPKTSLLDAIKNAPSPSDKDSLRAFLGLSEYYARFVQGYALVVQPHRNLLKKHAKFDSTIETQNAFTSIKELILSAPAIKPFTYGVQSIITDASAK